MIPLSVYICPKCGHPSAKNYCEPCRLQEVVKIKENCSQPGGQESNVHWDGKLWHGEKAQYDIPVHHIISDEARAESLKRGKGAKTTDDSDSLEIAPCPD